MQDRSVITYDDREGRNGANFIGVWIGSRPAGRIRIHENQYRAYTNQRAPGQAYLGTYRTMDAAGKRIVAELS